MYENEEIADGTFEVKRPDGKIVAKVSSVLVGNAAQEDWYLITAIPAGNSTHAVYIWPGSSNPDATHRFVRIGAGGGAPNFPAGVTHDHFKHSTAKQ